MTARSIRSTALTVVGLLSLMTASHAEDRYFFRSKGVVRETAPPITATVSIIGSDFRAGSPISGSLSSSFPSASWTFSQSPEMPSLSLTATDDVLSGAAPTVAGPIQFSISGTASSGNKSAVAQNSITVHPPLFLSGGPTGTLSAPANQPFPAQPAYVTVGLIGQPTFSLIKNGSEVNLGAECPGLSLSANGAITGTPTDACAIQSARVKLTDAFDSTSAQSGVFDIDVTPLASSVWAFGYNGSGQLGDNSNVSKSSPVNVYGGKKYYQVAGGYAHSCGLVEDGTVECWGRGSNGQLGNGNTGDSYRPIKVPGLSGARAIATGWSHSCAITGSGTYCWGFNAQGQLGDGSKINKTSPVKVQNLVDAKAIFANGNSTCAIVNGAAKCWGAFPGDGTNTQPSVPVQVSGLTSGVTSIGVGPNNTCAVVNGGVKCWGNPSSGTLGDGQTSVQFNAPQDVPGLESGATSVSVSSTHACAIVSGGAKCWGLNNYGQLGIGTIDASGVRTATDVIGLTNTPTALVVGESFSCALVSGVPTCWGINTSGQLGDGTFVNKSSPQTVVSGIPPIQKLAAGSLHVLAW